MTVELRVVISRASIDRYQPSLKPRCLIDKVVVDTQIETAILYNKC